MSPALLFLPLIGGIILLVATFVVRWRVDRADAGDGVPVSDEELNREKPSSFVVDIPFDYLAPLLERIEHAIDSGFSENQRASLFLRINSLFPGGMTYAIFPVRYDSQTTDILMHFGRIDQLHVRCRFESNAPLTARIEGFVRDISPNAA